MWSRCRCLADARAIAAAAVLASAAPFMAAPAGAQTILNVERLQPGDVEGWHWGVEGEFSLSRGNTEYVDVLAGIGLGHRWPTDWLRVFTGIDYRSETGAALQSDRFLHVRYNHWYADRWQSFHFVQLQASRTKLLERRMLIGSGVRHRLIDRTTTLDVGTGAMYEVEDLDGGRVTDDHPIATRVWRMANLVVATRQLTESVRLIGVGYIQPDLADLDDLRVLSDLSLTIALTDNVDLTLRGEWRHDSRPPGDLKRDDFVVRTGLTLSIR
jgi:putative salt-induced outer membrane protein YdiY